LRRPYFFEKFRGWTARRVIGYALAFAAIVALILLIIIKA